MKIFIIGPEGSGKTVLLAMLGRYVATERKDLVLEPVDRVASQYVITALETLEKGDWPPSTRQAELSMLQWRFGSRGAQLHEIVIFDAAGQDLRQILLAEKQESLTEKQRAIRTQIDAADVLVYLLDLNGFLGTKDISTLDENAWLFRTFLTRPEWRGKRRMVVLSKADIYADMLATPTSQETEDAKVRELVKHRLPKNYTLDHLVDAESAVSYFAIASVATKTVIGATGNPDRRPKNPLESVGLGKLVDTLDKHAAGIKEPEEGNWLREIVKHLRWIMPVLIACWILFHSVLCKPCGGRGSVSEQMQTQVSCSDCGGKGTVPTLYSIGDWGRKQCSPCNGTGNRTYPGSHAVQCRACKGSGKVAWWK